MLGQHKDEELENFLAATPNPDLQEFRKEFHTHPIKTILNELSQIFKRRLLSLLCGRNIKQAYRRRTRLDKRWIIEEINSYRRYRRFAENKTKTAPILIGNELASIDLKMALTIFSLNKLGIKTNFCCEGHRLTKDRTRSAYIALSLDCKFPPDLLKNLEDSTVKYNLFPQEKNDKYRGETLYPASFKEFNEPFVKALNEWATKQNNLSLLELRNAWKK